MAICLCQIRSATRVLWTVSEHWGLRRVCSLSMATACFFPASKTCIAVTYNCAPTTARRCRGAGSACVTYVNTCWIAARSSSAVGSFFFVVSRAPQAELRLSNAVTNVRLSFWHNVVSTRCKATRPCAMLPHSMDRPFSGLFKSSCDSRVRSWSKNCLSSNWESLRAPCRCSRIAPSSDGYARKMSTCTTESWVRPGPSQLQVPCPSAVMLGSDPVLFHPWSWRVVGCSWKQWTAQGHLSKQITCCSIWCLWKCIHDSDLPRLFEKGLTLAAVSSVTLYFPCCPQLTDERFQIFELQKAVENLRAWLTWFTGLGLFALGTWKQHRDSIWVWNAGGASTLCLHVASWWWDQPFGRYCRRPLPREQRGRSGPVVNHDLDHFCAHRCHSCNWPDVLPIWKNRPPFDLRVLVAHVVGRLQLSFDGPVMKTVTVWATDLPVH